jgi:hypothetical protein
VRKKPAPNSLDTADDVAPHRLHQRSLPRAGPGDKANFATRTSLDYSSAQI